MNSLAIETGSAERMEAARADSPTVTINAFTRYGRLGASSRVRLLQFLPALADAGIDVQVSELLDNRYVADMYASGRTNLALRSEGYVRRIREVRRSGGALSWIEKDLLPWIPLAVERVLAPLRRPYVVDIDDAVFHQYSEHPRAVVRALLSHKFDRLFADARLVIAGNDYLADRANAAGARWVEVVPSVVPVTRYAVREHHDRRSLRIGWIGSPASQHFLGAIAPALSRLATGRACELVLVGATRAPDSGMPVRMIGWSEAAETSVLAELDVGVMPLPDSSGARGKCGYKLIQSMASGLPVVASPVGVNSTIIRHGVDGFLATTTDDWVAALSTLRDDPELRRSMGAAARSRAVAHYSLEHWAPRLAAMLARASRS